MNNTKGVNKNISKEETKYIELLCNQITIHKLINSALSNYNFPKANCK